MTTISPGLTILYVQDMATSCSFWDGLLGAPAESSDGFNFYVLPGGGQFALWTASQVIPSAGGAPGAFELCASVPAAEVDRLHADWSAKGVPIAQAPVAREFGYSFVALDPDGNRLRILAPPA